MPPYDAVDLDLLRALAADPRASYVALAERLGLARNTVQARMTQLEARGAFLSFDRRIDTGKPVRYRDLIVDSKPKITPIPPGGGGNPPSLDRPHAARPWRTAGLR